MYTQVLADKAFKEWEDNIRTESQLYQIDDEVESISLSSKTKIIFKLKSLANTHFCYFQEADPRFFIDKVTIQENQPVILKCWSKRLDKSVFIFVHSVLEIVLPVGLRLNIIASDGSQKSLEIDDTRVTICLLNALIKITEDKEIQQYIEGRTARCCIECGKYTRRLCDECDQLFCSACWIKHKHIRLH